MWNLLTKHLKELFSLSLSLSLSPSLSLSLTEFILTFINIIQNFFTPSFYWVEFRLWHLLAFAGTKSAKLFFATISWIDVAIKSYPKGSHSSFYLRSDVGARVAEWYHTWLWTSECCAPPWAVSLHLSDIKHLIRPKHNIYAFFIILFGLFDLLLIFDCQICNVNCETKNC